MTVRHNETGPSRGRSWQQRLRRRISWTLLVKLFALLALWLLFFSPEHRISVTPRAVDAVLSVDSAPEPGNILAEGSNHDD